MWQDIVIAIVSVCFGVALIPQMITGFKIKKRTINVSTALITSLGVYAMAVAFLTLELYFAMAINFISGTLWFILFVQATAYKR